MEDWEIKEIALFEVTRLLDALIHDARLPESLLCIGNVEAKYRHVVRCIRENRKFTEASGLRNKGAGDEV